MKEKPLEDVIQGVLFSYNGENSFVQKVCTPFFNTVAENFINSGLKSAVDKPYYPPTNSSRQFQGPRNYVDPTLLLLGLSVFLKTPIGEWMVNKLCDEIYDAMIRPALKKLFTGYKEHGYNRLIEFKFEAYYEADDLHVLIHAFANSDEELQQIEALIPEAQQKALAWVEKNGITGKTLLYTIKNGELSNYPAISQERP